ncbi:fungal-specific transcription factor domain-containing protein [Aspergillus crustosus]
MSDSNAGRPPRRLLPLVSHDQQPIPPVRSQPKKAKSRDGCVTCKAKRRKCDEEKPACSQCFRRRIPCGGYSKELTWRHEGFENPSGPKPAARSSCTGIRRTRRKKPINSSPPELENLVVEQASEPKDLTGEEEEDTVQSRDDFMQFLGTSTGASASEQAMDFDAFFSGLTSMIVLPEQQADGEPIESDQTLGFASFLDMTSDPLELTEEQDAQFPQPWYSPIDKPDTPSPNSPKQGLFNWYRRLDISDGSPENIASVFNHRICEVLCIVDTPTGNPWRQIVWPLAQKHLALYHAIAAMTCFNGLPRLRAEGFRHLETSVQTLSLSQQDSMPLEVMATTLVALAIGQTWYYPRSYNGTKHLKKARGLIQALSVNLASQPSRNCASLRFLTNTWMYMDVLTRITCPNDPPGDGDGDGDGDTDTIIDLTSTASSPEDSSGPHIDPLMGCANTLFPLIGRVADLVGRIRRSPQKTNSPTIVSLAVELMTAIDRWTPNLDLSSLPLNTNTDTVNPDASDLFQTANAYKWATLLLLYQAVPELPCRMSYADIVRKVLVFIATVPLSSKAVFFPIFPLMVAGCEAVDREDREWVRNRWRSLSTFNGSGIADRCLELTLEVWRRSDERDRKNTVLESNFQDCSRSAPESFSTADIDFVAVSESGHGHGALLLGSLDVGCLCKRPACPKRPVSSHTSLLLDSPNESTYFSVRSEMHWLSVMRDWGWEVVLG